MEQRIKTQLRGKYVMVHLTEEEYSILLKLQQKFSGSKSQIFRMTFLKFVNENKVIDGTNTTSSE